MVWCLRGFHHSNIVLLYIVWGKVEKQLGFKLLVLLVLSTSLHRSFRVSFPKNAAPWAGWERSFCAEAPRHQSYAASEKSRLKKKQRIS